jgi:hypothetical protein
VVSESVAQRTQSLIRSIKKPQPIDRAQSYSLLLSPLKNYIKVTLPEPAEDHVAQSLVSVD